MAKSYPCIGSTGFRTKWHKTPTTAPWCIVPACGCRASHQPWIEVSWFRGDAERSGPVCKVHSLDAKLLLIVTADWKAAQQKSRAASSLPQGGE